MYARASAPRSSRPPPRLSRASGGGAALTPGTVPVPGTAPVSVPRGGGGCRHTSRGPQLPLAIVLVLVVGGLGGGGGGGGGGGLSPVRLEKRSSYGGEVGGEGSEVGGEGGKPGGGPACCSGGKPAPHWTGGVLAPH